MKERGAEKEEGRRVVNAVAKNGGTEGSEEEMDRRAYEWLTKEIGYDIGRVKKKMDQRKT